MDDNYRAAFDSMIRVIAVNGKPRNQELVNQEILLCDYDIFNSSQVLSAEITYNYRSAIVKKGRPLSFPELLCYSSHFHLWMDFVKSDKKRLVVMEDDVSADWTAIGSILGSADLMSLNGMIRLFTRMPAKHHILGTTKNRFVTRIVGYGGGAQGYILSRGHAIALLDYCKDASRPIDDQIDRYWDHGVKSYCIYPFPILENIFPSLVQISCLTHHNVSIYHKIARFVYLCKDISVRKFCDTKLYYTVTKKHFHW